MIYAGIKNYQKKSKDDSKCQIAKNMWSFSNKYLPKGQACLQKFGVTYIHNT